MYFFNRRASSSWSASLCLVTGLAVALVLAAGGALAQAPESSQAPEAAPAAPELPPPPAVSAGPMPEPTYAPAPDPAAPPPMDPTVSVPLLSHRAHPPLATVTAPASVTARPAPTTASAGTDALPRDRPALTVPTPAGQGVRVSAMLRAEIRLDRAHYSPGEIDGRGGFNAVQALKAFQRAAGLPESGLPDVATVDALEARDNAPLLVIYTLTARDLAGPFAPLPRAMADKALLTTLGYASPAEALAEHFHVSPGLLQAMNPRRRLVVGAGLTVPNTEAILLPPVARVRVSRTGRTLTAFDAAGHAVGQFPVSSGSSHDPLPIGVWRINDVERNPVYHYNPELFWDANKNGEEATLPAGPNNPVGVVWLSLSKPHYGIHGTPNPANIGRTHSHGCIRMTNWDVSLLARSVRPGTVVDLVP